MSRVLVVDDEKSIRNTLCEFLMLDGFAADCAPDVATACQMLDGADYDVVVSDIIMPRASGMELLEKIHGKSGNIQSIIMTGEPSVETAIRAVQNDANDYLIKPISREAFLKAVRTAARIKALIDEKTELELQKMMYQKDLERTVEQRTKELQNAMQGVISLLSSVVEARDPYTAGHQRRVGNLSAALADRLGLDGKSVRYMQIMGYIHDVGKITIPTEILSKPGKLSLLEVMLIQNHSTAGFEMLSKVDLPGYVAETVYQHHERCDGSGYPRGLKSDDISQSSKILMVADVVEAMMSHRPYRPALGLDAALAEIRKYSGIKYSPEVVETCISLFEKEHYEIDDREHKTSFPL